MKYYTIKSNLKIILSICFILSIFNMEIHAENFPAFRSANSCDNNVFLAKADLTHHKQEVAARLPAIKSSTVGNPAMEALSVVGLVQNPVWLTKKDLSRFNQAIPIRTLLEIARIQRNAKDKMSAKTKTGSDNIAEKGKNIKNNSDIAISIKNKDGKQVVFSLDSILECSEDQITIVNQKNNRLPDLVIKKGSKSIFPLKNIISIDVMQFSINGDNDKNYKFEYIIQGNNGSKMFLDDVSAKCKVVDIPIKNMKELPQQSSKNSYRGFSLYEALSKTQIKAEHTDIFTVISIDGETASFSLFELEKPNPPVIIQNKKGDRYSYDLIVKEDKSKVRWIKNIGLIKQVDLKQKPMIYVIGMGCGDAGLLTNQAISYMGRADVFICMEKYKHNFAGYMSGKPVLFDPFLQLPAFCRKNHPELSVEESEKMAKEVYNRDMQMIRDALNSGKTVALLEPGDPAIYGGWRNWLSPNFSSDKIKIIPGISSFTVGNAILGKYDITETSLIITEPETIKKDESLIKSAAETDSTMVIFMGISRIGSLAPIFAKYYAVDTPVHLIFYAGITGSEIKMKTTLGKVAEDIGSDKENFLGLIYIGNKLR